jgi:hypothetical protein
VDLPDPNVKRGHLDALVLADELERLLEREISRRDQANELVTGRRPHVRELLLLRRVDVHVFRTRVLPDDHPFVDLDPRTNEQRAALLEIEQREVGGRSAPVGDEASGRACSDLAVPRLVALEDVM